MRDSLWPYRIIALLIAVALWYVNSLERRLEQGEKTVEAILSFNNLPSSLVVLNDDLPVSVRVRGSNREIRRLRPKEIDIQVDLSDAEAGPYSVDLGEASVFLPADDLEALAMEPNVLNLQIDELATKRLPIDVELIGEAAAGLIANSVEIFPNTAQVQGPRTLLDNLGFIALEPVSLDRRGRSFDVRTEVPSPNRKLRVSPSYVTVRVVLSEPPPANGGGP